MEEESMFVHLKKKHCLNKLLTVKGAKRLTLPALREQVPRDTNIVIQNATMKKLNWVQTFDKHFRPSISREALGRRISFWFKGSQL